MKVALLSTFEDKGGAAIACRRLQNALLSKKIDASFIYQNTASLASKARLFGEIAYASLHLTSQKNRFSFSPSSFGIDISSNSAMQNADIIHLHWINQGFLSLNSLRKIAKLNKPIVWTLHDMWAFTGGCHHSRDCNNYQQECHCCPYLKPKSSLAHRIWEKKKNIFSNLNLHIVTCSEWLGKCAKESSLFRNTPVSVIPNPIDTTLYTPISAKKNNREKLQLPQDKFIISMVALNVTDERKGFTYLQKAISLLEQTAPELFEKLFLVLIGQVKDEDCINLNIPFKSTNYVHNPKEMSAWYQASDAFVLPSLEENLPNTIMEAMSCGIPCLAFDVGGIKDLISHQQTGYLAQYLSSSDLAQGLKWLYEHEDKLGITARKKVEENFSIDIVSKQYIDLYNNLLRS